MRKSPPPPPAASLRARGCVGVVGVCACARWQVTVIGVQGNEAQRILGGEKKRQEDKEKFEATKRAIHEKNKVSAFNNKFGTSKGDVLHTEYSAKTVGLVTLDELKKTKEELAKKEIILDQLNREKEIKAEIAQKEQASKKRKTKVSKASLSFAEDLDGDGGEQEEEEVVVKKRIVKNPNVNTSFLPDKERELQEIEKRKQLTEEWQQEQDKKKAEKLEITFSYWDGSGHRRSVTCTKGTNVGQFLEICRKSLMDEFRELRGCSSENLIYIKVGAAKKSVAIPGVARGHELPAFREKGHATRAEGGACAPLRAGCVEKCCDTFLYLPPASSTKVGSLLSPEQTSNSLYVVGACD